MPTKDRKYYIKRHNEVTEAENRKHSEHGMELDGASMNNIADMALHRNGKAISTL